jgi:hypothetical protein
MLNSPEVSLVSEADRAGIASLANGPAISTAVVEGNLPVGRPSLRRIDTTRSPSRKTQQCDRRLASSTIAELSNIASRAAFSIAARLDRAKAGSPPS